MAGINSGGSRSRSRGSVSTHTCGPEQAHHCSSSCCCHYAPARVVREAAVGGNRRRSCCMIDGSAPCCGIIGAETQRHRQAMALTRYADPVGRHGAEGERTRRGACGSKGCSAGFHDSTSAENGDGFHRRGVHERRHPGQTARFTGRMPSHRIACSPNGATAGAHRLNVRTMNPKEDADGEVPACGAKAEAQPRRARVARGAESSSTAGTPATLATSAFYSRMRPRWIMLLALWAAVIVSCVAADTDHNTVAVPAGANGTFAARAVLHDGRARALIASCNRSTYCAAAAPVLRCCYFARLLLQSPTATWIRPLSKAIWAPRHGNTAIVNNNQAYLVRGCLGYRTRGAAQCARGSMWGSCHLFINRRPATHAANS